MLVWIVLWTKLIIYRVPPDSVILSCRGFGFIWRELMTNWMLLNKNYFKVYNRNQVNAISNMKLAISLMNFECQPCGIFEGLSYHQKYEVIDPIFFAANVGLVDRINNLVSSKFMGMVSSVSFMFDTGATYSCYSKK